MPEFSRDEAARRAGVERDYVDRLIELGIINPRDGDILSKGDVRRAEMARTLERAGLPTETLAAAIGSGKLTLAFMDSPVYERFATLSDETFAQVSERTGVPVHLLMTIREATGAAVPNPDDLMRDDELRVLPAIKRQAELGFRPKATERSLRTYGDALRRMAATEADAWASEIMAPLLARGLDAGEFITTVTGTESEELDQATDAALLALWHAQQARAWTSNIITGFERQLAAAGMLTRLQHPPAMCFLDITGYTRLTQEHGDEAAATLAERLGRLVNRSSIDRGGRPVKWLGDGVMLYFPDPGRGVMAALDMVDGVRSAELPPAHVGLHAGPVLFQEGDYFGTTVNVASRIAEYARPGEVLVSEDVVEASGDSADDAGMRFTEIGPVELKGVPEPVRLLAAHRA